MVRDPDLQTARGGAYEDPHVEAFPTLPQKAGSPTGLTRRGTSRRECGVLDEMSWPEAGQGDRVHVGRSAWLSFEAESRPSHSPGFSIPEITQA